MIRASTAKTFTTLTLMLFSRRKTTLTLRMSNLNNLNPLQFAKFPVPPSRTRSKVGKVSPQCTRSAPTSEPLRLYTTAPCSASTQPPRAMPCHAKMPMQSPVPREAFSLSPSLPFRFMHLRPKKPPLQLHRHARGSCSLRFASRIPDFCGVDRAPRLDAAALRSALRLRAPVLLQG